MKLTEKKLISMYRKMVEIRRFEESIQQLYFQGIVSTAHLCIGQEAIAVGVCSNLRKEDYIVTNHRGHGHTIAKGASLNGVAAEILGKGTGLCGGKGGFRLTSVEDGVMWAVGIVGSQIPIAAGLGLSLKLKKKENVVACFFGDGASNQGSFHEGLNLSSIWKLPVVYVCENNLYGQYTRVEKSTSIVDISDRASAYGIPGVTLDGNDVIAVYEATFEAVNRAKQGYGPTLLECKTYRWLGHYVGDPATYRPKEEVEEWKKKDPISRLAARLLKVDVLDNSDLEKIGEEAEMKIKEAIEFAMESPNPSPNELTRHVF
jgi:TPP-dependent pyruvate/acetoin dehydrogenase alpha subunit